MYSENSEKSNPEKVIYYKSVLTTLSIPSFRIDTIHGPRKLDERLKIVSNNIFEKNKPNAFSKKELTNLIEYGSTKDIIVIGIMLDFEVLKTLYGGKKLGFNMYMIPEAIGICCGTIKEEVLKRLKKKGIKQMPIEKI